MDLLVSLGGVIVKNAPSMVGVILPPLIEVLNKDVKSDQAKHVVALVICFIVAVILHWNEIEYGDPTKIAVYTGVIFTESQTIFRLYFANSFIREIIRTKLNEEQETEELQMVTSPTE